MAMPRIDLFIESEIWDDKLKAFWVYIQRLTGRVR